jgi:hypothetical protein
MSAFRFRWLWIQNILAPLDTLKNLNEGVPNTLRREVLLGKSASALLHGAALSRLAGEQPQRFRHSRTILQRNDNATPALSEQDCAFTATGSDNGRTCREGFIHFSRARPFRY